MKTASKEDTQIKDAPTLFPDTPLEHRGLVVSPAEMIREALGANSNTSLENLGKLLELQERWEANQAMKAYHKAMAAFKANPPLIEKDKRVAYGNTKYNHASLANVTRKINDALSQHGLSASWKVSKNGVISVTCKITHEQGHSEETTLSADADASGAKNPIQAIGSTITYLERYTLLALTGLATNEMDTDGMIPAEKITESDVSAIIDHLNDIGSSVDKFCEYMKVSKLEDITKSDLPKAQAAIKSAREKRAKAATK